MSAPPALAMLQTKLGEIVDLVKTSALLSWDQQTQMPPLGSEARAQQLGTVGRLAHEAFVSDEVGALLEELRPYGESLDHDSFEASLIRVVQRDYDKSVRVPPELSAETTRAGSRAFGVWVEARTRSDYELFRPALEEMVELKHRYVDCFPPAEDPYDTLLDDYEPGMKAAEVRTIFDRLKEELIPLIEAARSSATPPVPATSRRPPSGSSRSRCSSASASSTPRGGSTPRRTRSRRRSRRATSGSRRVSQRIRSTGSSR